MKIKPITTYQNRGQKQPPQNNPSFNGWVLFSNTSFCLSKHLFQLSRRGFSANQDIANIDLTIEQRIRDRKIIFKFPDIFDAYAAEAIQLIKSNWPSAKAEGVLEGQAFRID